MAISFPTSSTSGQLYEYNGVTYIREDPVWSILDSASTSGTSGSSGSSGQAGTSGTSGIGSSGTSGTSGTGISGTSGTSGTSGAAGTSGTSGTGSSGTSGTSGTGISGTSGTSGASGTSGSSGSSGTAGADGRSGFGGYVLYMNYIKDTSPTISNLSTSSLASITGQLIQLPTGITYSPTENTDVSQLGVSPDLTDSQTTVRFTTPNSNTIDVIVNQFAFYKSLITPSTNILPPGIWEMNVYAKADANNDVDNIGLRFFLLGRNSTSGAYTNLITNGSDIGYLYDNVTSQIITLSMYVQNPIDISGYDAFLIALTSRNRNASSHTAEVYFQSSNTYSHIHTTFAKTGIDGTSGTSGSSGTSGQAGADGVTPDWYFQGAWPTSGLTPFAEIGDIYTYNGETWYNSGGASGTPSEANGWAKLAAKGTSGTSGTSGAAGVSGTAGTSGTSGTTPAFTTNYVQTSGTSITFASTSALPATVISANITTTGKPVFISVTGDANPLSSASWGQLRLYRGTSGIGTIVNFEGSAANENNPYCITYIDEQAAGTYTYSLRLVAIAGGSIQMGEGGGPTLSVFEITGPGTSGSSGTTPTAPGNLFNYYNFY